MMARGLVLGGLALAVAASSSEVDKRRVVSHLQDDTYKNYNLGVRAGFAPNDFRNRRPFLPQRREAVKIQAKVKPHYKISTQIQETPRLIDSSSLTIALRANPGAVLDRPFVERTKVQNPVESSRQDVVQMGQPNEPVSSMLKGPFGKPDLAVCFTYFCNMFALSLPIVLLPMIAAEQTGVSTTKFVTTVASISTLGGAAGKFVNGFVCQQVGGRKSSMIYLAGMACATFLLSTMASNVGIPLAAMEFFASMQWTASSVVLANHYKQDPKGLSGAISALALSSTAGLLFCKTVGPLLLNHLRWTQVAQVGTMVAILGSLVMMTAVSEYPRLARLPKKEPFSMHKIVASIKGVLGASIFWRAGIAHGMAFIVRSSDKILGSFFQQATHLPASVCGGLTVSVTLGFVHGLVSGKKFNDLDSVAGKVEMWRGRYIVGTLSAFSLALLSNKNVLNAFASPYLVAGAMAVSSAVMASSVAFQFYQSPSIASDAFGKDKAVSLSFLDGIGWLITAPVWMLVGSVVGSNKVGSHGWTIAWSIIAGLIAIGGAVMTDVLPSILHKRGRKDL